MSSINKLTNTKKTYYRSLNEVENTPEFQEHAQREFPVGASELPEGFSRRRWMQLMGASLALTAAGCRYEEEIIAPFVKRPTDRIPGLSKKYASAYEIDGVGYPLLVTSYDGRPIKVDGNPDFAFNGGGSTPFMQACVLDLYDPDRSRSCWSMDGTTPVEKSFEDFKSAVAGLLVGDGKGVAILARPSSSPTRAALKAELLAKYAGIQWFEYSSLNRDNEYAGANAAFQQVVRPLYDLSKAKTIVAIDADLLGDHPNFLAQAKGWAAGRDVDHMVCSRLFAIESQMSTTGISADNRLPVKSSAIPGLVAALEAEVAKRLAGDATANTVDSALPAREKFLAAVAQDLVANKGAGVVAVGANQSAEVHAAAHRINAALGNIGAEKPVSFLPAFEYTGSQLESISKLADALNSGSVETLIVLDSNPVYDAPAELKFADAFAKAKNRIHVGLYVDETALKSTWHVNLAHSLEAWNDTRAYNGTWCVAQPLIDPIFGAHSVIEVLAVLSRGEIRSGRELVRETVAAGNEAYKDDEAWHVVVHDGLVANSQSQPVEVSAPAAGTLAPSDTWKSDGEDSTEFEVVFTASPSTYDGRFANNGWLQESPNPVTKVTWDNAALVAPSTAKKLKLTQNVKVQITVGGNSIEVPVHIQPGQAKGSIGVNIGYGRTAAGVVGGSTSLEADVAGVDIAPIRSKAGWYVATGAELKSTGERYELAVTQDHHAIDDLGLKEITSRIPMLVREGTFEDFKHYVEEHHLNPLSQSASHDHAHDEAAGGHGEDKPASEKSAENAEPAKGKAKEEHHSTQWPAYHAHFKNQSLNPGPAFSETNKWGMSIDLHKCIGCTSCSVACQSENNIPFVGKDQVARSREMHWLRIDRYYNGASLDGFDNPVTVLQPMTCQQCENAPCEQVCPVAATVHSHEGLNDMAYNRCIGTRYCANNCPYKVRRFNYLNFSEAVTFIKYPWADKLTAANRQLRNLVMNPDVTIRSRGVMEKCTYCVQRIQNTKIKARIENRPIGANEIRTACQDACPTGAIKFGDLSNKEAEVTKEHDKVRAYIVLDELHLGQRTRYLARVRNPHPSLPLLDAKSAAPAH